MKKLWIAVLLLAMSISISAEGLQTNISAGFGVQTINGQTYNSVHISPEITLGKLGLGLDMDIQWNDSEGLRTYHKEDYYDWIKYIRYGQKWEEPIFVKLGMLDDVTLGTGILVRDYDNQSKKALLERRKDIGAQFDIYLDKFGFESFVNNLDKADLFGGRVYIKPLKLFSDDIPFFSKLELGYSQVVDQREGGVFYKDFRTHSADIRFPIIDKLLIFQAAYAKLNNGLGKGYLTGFTGKIGEENIKFSYVIEYRNLKKNFIAGIFGKTYELQKDSLASILPDSDADGYYGKAEFTFFDLLTVSADYEKYNKTDYYASSASANVDLSKIIETPSVKVQGDYQKRKSERPVVTGSVAYGISQNASLVYAYTVKYDENNNKIKLTSIYTSFNF